MFLEEHRHLKLSCVWHILKHPSIQSPLHNLSTKTLFFSLPLFITNSASLLWPGFLLHSKKFIPVRHLNCVVRQALQVLMCQLKFHVLL
jgi:hypothetical protein